MTINIIKITKTFQVLKCVYNEDFFVPFFFIKVCHIQRVTVWTHMVLLEDAWCDLAYLSIISPLFNCCFMKCFWSETSKHQTMLFYIYSHLHVFFKSGLISDMCYVTSQQYGAILIYMIWCNILCYYVFFICYEYKTMYYNKSFIT